MVDQRFSVAVHVMTVLAFEKCENGNLYTSERLARSVRTNPTVVRRLVSRLVEAGVLKAYKGKSGGVELARGPKDISLEDIYNAVSEKTLLYAPTRRAHKPCATSRCMGKLMKYVIHGFEEHSKRYLAGISLQDLASRVEAEA